MATKAQSSRVTWVWGDAKKGICVVRSPRKSKGKYWWDVHHVKDGKTTHMARDFSVRAEALKEARSYAAYRAKHPRAA
ncbi:MAG: hypothetical protein V1737_02840, partial [Chloroflexota bacterium]